MPDHGVVERFGRRIAPRQRLRSLLNAGLPYVTRAVFGLLDPAVLDRDGLRRAAEARGACFEYGTEEAFSLAPPASPAEPGGTIAARVGDHRLPQPFVAELPDCTLLGAYPVALSDANEVVLEVAPQRSVLVLNLLGSLGALARRPDRLRTTATFDVACPLVNYWSSGYFHWTFESLIRLEGLERYEARTGRRPTLLLGPDPRTWQVETLALLGYGPDEWVAWAGTRASVGRLVVPTVRREHVLSPGAVRWLRERVRDRRDGALPDPGAFPDRVYVSRADADRRRVVNEAALVDALGKRGFQRLVLSGLSVPEQVALFAGADVVVAPHGAGLTNLAYADDPVVVELFRAGDVRGQYYQLASILGFEYHYRVADRVGGDLLVDVGAVVDLVEDVLAGRRRSRTG